MYLILFTAIRFLI